MLAKQQSCINCTWEHLYDHLCNKTCRLMNQVVATTPTIGSNVEEVVYKNLHFIMWDIGGQESLRQSWSTYYINTKVCVVTFNSFVHCIRQLLWL